MFPSGILPDATHLIVRLAEKLFRVRLAEKLGMRSIILSRLELELKSESSNTMNRT